MTAAVGFIGLGAMGSRMARRLAGRGHAVIGYDIDPASMHEAESSGISPATSPREVADRAEAVFLALPSLDAARSVALGTDGIAGGTAVRVVADLSTTGAAFARELAAALSAHGIPLVDAPVSGGLSGATQGTLSIMVSGPRQAVDLVRPLLDVIGSSVHYMGLEAGQAQTMKLINNALSTSALALSCEAFVVGVKAGLDPDRMVEVLNSSTGRNSATLNKIPRAILTRTFDYGATTDITRKDLGLYFEEAEALGVPLWATGGVRALWNFALTQGAGPHDNTTLMKYLEAWAGVEVRGRAASVNSEPPGNNN